MTAKERLEVYYKLRDIFLRQMKTQPRISGFCHALVTASISGTVYAGPTIRLDSLDELYKHRPHTLATKEGHWFTPGECVPRLELLELAIAECLENIKNEQ